MNLIFDTVKPLYRPSRTKNTCTCSIHPVKRSKINITLRYTVARHKNSTSASENPLIAAWIDACANSRKTGNVSK